MSDYRIYNDMDARDIMDCLSDAEKLDFVYGCYDCLSVEQQKDFIETLGADEVVYHLGDEEIVEHLDDETLIEELKLRGYEITKDGSEDIKGKQTCDTNVSVKVITRRRVT